MPLELGIWRIDRELCKVNIEPLDKEKRFEDILDQDISIVSPNWMIIGRQVFTGYGSCIDLLAIDRDGNLVIIELKKDKTPREVIAQLLDYASWVKELNDNDIAKIFLDYRGKYHINEQDISLDDAFMKHFKVQKMPDELNTSHEMVVVASYLDESTERIVSYLAEEHNVPINAVFFRVFKDDEREYLSRVWFIDPSVSKTIRPDTETKEPWNGEFYVSFGTTYNWEDAVEFGFIIGGGGSWYSKTLFMLELGNRIWVNIPGIGYVGVGEVIGTAVRADNFVIKKGDNTKILLSEANIRNKDVIFENVDNDELANYMVPVNWIKTIGLNQAVKEPVDAHIIIDDKPMETAQPEVEPSKDKLPT
jgi:hypothetical protein